VHLLVSIRYHKCVTLTNNKYKPIDELMLALCRNDQEEDLENLLDEGNVNLSFVDGAGNSAAHYA
jgi:hypothetical protein